MRYLTVGVSYSLKDEEDILEHLRRPLMLPPVSTRKHLGFLCAI